MRYEYTVIKEGGESELIKAMSWKKALKKVLMLHPKFNGSITYINKKGNVPEKAQHMVIRGLLKHGFSPSVNIILFVPEQTISPSP